MHVEPDDAPLAKLISINLPIFNKIIFNWVSICKLKIDEFNKTITFCNLTKAIDRNKEKSLYFDC